MSLTQKRLKELLTYHRASGRFTRRVSTTASVRVGDIAGGRNKDGYVYISLLGVKYRANRLAWFYVTGTWPTGEVDHKNTARDDNRWTNLRELTHAANKQNIRAARRDSKTGLLGVTRNHNRFKAEITVDGELNYLGTFSTPELAHGAYLDAKRRLHSGNTL